MSYDIVVAKLFKDRDNIKADEPTIGQVISISPVIISIYSGQVLLNKDLIELSGDFCTYTGSCLVDGKTGTCTIDRTLKVGEYVKCIPTSSGQKWFIVR